MKYTNSIYTPDLSGKQGNVVFSSNQYGTYTCDRRIPVDNKTDAQKNVRNSTSDIARAWAMLTQEQRENWTKVSNENVFIKKGKQYVLPGFYFFMKLNRNLYEVNELLLKNPPAKQNSQTQTFSSFEVRLVNTPAGTDLLLFIYPSINANTKIILSATMALKVTKSYSSQKTRKIAVLDSSFVSGSSIKEYYLKKYPVLPGIMEKAFFDFRATNINSGFSGTPKSCEVYGI